MKKLLLLILVAILAFSCKKHHQIRNIKQVTIQEFKMDSTSIRAIIANSVDTLLFVGTKGDIGMTKDGGKTWDIQYVKYQDSIVPYFRSITQNKHGVFALSIENPALLYRISSNSTKIVYQEEHLKVFYDAMQFFPDGEHGIAVGDPTENCPSIITTIDGGNTWKKLPCEQLPVFDEGEAFFAASNTNIKIINNTIWIVSGGKKARVLKSTDKGKTWAIYNTPIIQGTSSQGIYSVDFADEQNGIIIGGDYIKPNDNCANKAITTDGGKTWQLVADNQNPTYKSCVQYVPETNGKEVFAVGKTGVSFSNDGGHTWKNVSNDSYYSIQFVDKNNAWLSGHQKIGKLKLN